MLRKIQLNYRNQKWGYGGEVLFLLSGWIARKMGEFQRDIVTYRFLLGPYPSCRSYTYHIQLQFLFSNLSFICILINNYTVYDETTQRLS